MYNINYYICSGDIFNVSTFNFVSNEFPMKKEGLLTLCQAMFEFIVHATILVEI